MAHRSTSTSDIESDPRVDREEPGAADAPAPAYEPPRILFRQAIDRVAAVCTPAPPGKGSLAQGCSVGSS